MTRALDCASNRPLVVGAGACLTARPDLGSFREEAPERIVILIVDPLGALDTERTHFLTAHEAALTAAALTK